MSPRDPPTQSTSTCDRCRVLKVKCHPADEVDGDESGGSRRDEARGGATTSQAYSLDRHKGKGRGICKRCLKAGHSCTFDYEFKRSGRPPGTSAKRRRSNDETTLNRHQPSTSTSPRPSSSSRPSIHSAPLDLAPPPPPPPRPHAHHHRSSHSHSHSHSRSNPSVSPASFLDLSNPTPPFHASSSNSFPSPHDHIPAQHPPGSHGPPPRRDSHLSTHTVQPDVHHDAITPQDSPWEPLRNSIFGSARTALEGAGDPGQPWLSGLFNRRLSFDFSLPDETGHGTHHPQHGQQHHHLTQNHVHPGRSDVAIDGDAQAQSSGNGIANSTSDPSILGQASGNYSQNAAMTGGNNGGLNILASASSSSAGLTVPLAAPQAPSQTGAGMMGVNMGGMGGDRFVSPIPLPKSSDYFSELGGPMPQVEAIGTWSEFCFFVSLYMRHQHALVPLVHKPTFAMDVLHRRDQRDEAFRGLLFSIVTYTICQCPINIMSKDFSRDRLLVLLEQCQRASRIIQIRHLSRPNLIVAASTELDILSSQATNKPELTAALFADAHRMQYTLRLNAAQPPEGLSPIDVEMGRRIFWHLYSTDRTHVMNGGTMLIHHQEGLPPLPLEIDDEQLSNSTSHPLPASAAHPTYISGFVTLVKIFVILGECQHRHRTLNNDPELSQELPTLNRWLDNAVERLRKITDKLPVEFRAKEPRTEFGPTAATNGSGLAAGMEDDSDATAGIQQANICITALCVEFALLDLRLALRPGEDLRPEREKIAKSAYATLSSIPLEYLASNGEAMRGKVLRTILALFNASTSPEEIGNGVWDWWSMYSQVQFIQVIPAA
ncbi:hypothetical protein DB88DRAFT_499777 [Papiliotrema laurentii]|uniref:Xylanolytic transcriptional activator regulatory domain-containing protein n=1 Tax=Papiliotrema laurentii TaxID=5418 RepID=A0AAD9CSL2_PAPLA|nr:hypothetical protein DB88DRAFT_499777 [Papiliotrema laurentii]